MLVCMIIGGMGLQFLWGQQNYLASARTSGGLYVEGVQGRVDTLNPLFVSSSAEASAARLIFSSLYNYDETGSLHQDLATGMTIDPTGKIYTVKIRSDATWHDGVRLTADDIVFTILTIKNPATRSPLRVNWLDVAVSATDKSTVQFTLPAVYAPFPHALIFPIIPRHLLADTAPSALRESIYSQQPIGSGPFSFKLLQQTDTAGTHKVIHMVANNDYYAGTPKISRFELHAYVAESALLDAVKAGELSGATDIPVVAMESIDHSRYTVVPETIDSGVYLLVNTSNPILKDVVVRRALQLATNTSAIRKLFSDSVGVLDGPLLSSQITGADTPHTPTVDPKKAAQTLDDAGWKMVGGYRVKDNQKLQITITTTADKEYEKVIAEVERQWKAIGIKVDHRIIDTSTASSSFVQDVLQGRSFDILLYKLSIGADPDVYAYWHSSQVSQAGYNFSGYSSKVSDASLSSARSRLEPDLRNAKYKQFARQWIEDVPAIALYQPVIGYVYNKDLSTIEPGMHLVSGVDRYANVQYWTVVGDTVYKTP